MAEDMQDGSQTNFQPPLRQSFNSETVDETTAGKEPNEVDPRKVDPIKIDKVNIGFLTKSPYIDPDFHHSYDDLEVGQAWFVPNEYGQTTDVQLQRVYREIASYQLSMSEVERDINGDTVLEQVIIEARRHNPDGTLMLGPDGNVLKGALPETRPKLIYFRHFVARAVVKGQQLTDDEKSKSDRDGVLIIRVV